MATQKHYKLHYFDGRGRAEQIRWILVQGGARWEDRRIKQSDWPAIKPSEWTEYRYLIIQCEE